MNRKEKISFAPRAINDKKRFPHWVALIVAAALLLGLISFGAILAMNDFDLKRALGAREEESTMPAGEETSEGSTAEAQVSLEQFTEAVNFMFLCAENKEIDFCQIISVNPSENLIRIKPVSLDFALETEAGRRSLTEVYKNGAPADLIKAFSKKGIEISRYVIIDEDGFVSLIQKLGAVDMTLEKEFSFEGDELRYTFDAGDISMNADAFLQYMKFASTGDDLLRVQGEAAAAAFRTHFTAENAEKGGDFFSELINLVKTDINAFDYSGAAAVIRTMASSGAEISVIS